MKSTAVSLKTEFVAGLTTFLTMSYIIVVNPTILSTEGTGMPFSGVLTATVLLCFSMTLLMGLYAKLPFAVAPGMGINAFFTFSLVIGEGIPWPTALGMVFWAGVVFLLISVTPLREKLARALPHNIKIAAAVGIGLFLAFIGLKNAGFVVADSVTFVRMGEWNSSSLLAALGLLILLPLMSKRHPLAFLISIGVVTLAALALGKTQLPETFFSSPDFSSVFFKLDIWGALKLSLLPAVFAIMFTDLFDSISTFVGVSRAGGLLDKDGQPLRLRQGLIVDALATLFAGLFGTSSGTAYIESASGIEAGGRSGWTAIFAALLFLPFLFIAPLASTVPGFATAPVLIGVGLLMFKSIFDLETKRFEDWAPAVLTIILIPLTFSITKGLLWGLFAHTFLYACVGRGRELSAGMWGLGLISAGYLIWG